LQPPKEENVILVTGASGTVGRAVLDEVRQTGKPFKAMFRNEGEAPKERAGVTTVIADFADKNGLRRALVGVDSVFLVCSPVPQLVELESNVIEACRESGVRHVVLNSALGAEDYPKSFPSWHRKVEDGLRASGLGYTIFRPNSFMQNILAYSAPTIRAKGAFYSAMGAARTSYLDVRDIAAVVVKALTSPTQHTGEIYELNGPESITNAELAERISRVAGRPVEYVNISEDAQRKNMQDAGMPEWQITALLDLQRYYTAGKGGEVTNVLPELLGRAPKRLNAFLEEFKDSFRSLAAGV
jgi:uncharacterized protein YbjT (DUF2867 family)